MAPRKKSTDVESDAEWTKKVDGLRKRKPAEDWLTVPDLDALEAAKAAQVEARAVERAVKRRILAETDEDLTAEVLAELVAADEEVVAAASALSTAIDDAQAREVTFHFRSLPPAVYESLQHQHPPTEDQEQENLAYNPDTYVPALIAACSVRPLTAEQVAALIEPDEDGNTAFNDGDINAMFNACKRINERPRLMLGKGSRPTQD